MIRVILESPYAGNVKRNVQYARECVKHSLSLGEAPIASHLLYTQDGILNDEIEEERKLGIDAGLAWKNVAEKHVFYIDFGMSKGMEYGLKYATENDIPVEMRTIREKKEKVKRNTSESKKKIRKWKRFLPEAFIGLNEDCSLKMCNYIKEFFSKEEIAYEEFFSVMRSARKLLLSEKYENIDLDRLINIVKPIHKKMSEDMPNDACLEYFVSEAVVEAYCL